MSNTHTAVLEVEGGFIKKEYKDGSIVSQSEVFPTAQEAEAGRANDEEAPVEVEEAEEVTDEPAVESEVGLEDSSPDGEDSSEVQGIADPAVPVVPDATVAEGEERTG
jgi:hypothetical protein